MVKKIIKITAISLASLIGAVILAVVIYVIYVSAQYYRIADRTEIAAENPQQATLSAQGAYRIATYNIGFGAYTQEFSFFMDTGSMKNGKKTHGKGSKAKDADTVVRNTDGATEEIRKLDADFMFFQEVDTDSTRSRHVNQFERIQNVFPEFSSSFASNFHSAFLFYPIFDPHGTVNAGIATLSRYRVDESIRRSFPIDNGFPAKYLDLDRCFMVSRLPLDNGKQLVLINQHMSAYDKGGVIRAQQLAMLNGVLKEERDAGNYVIMGGDFNHVLTGEEVAFPTEQNVPAWVARLSPEDLAEGYVIAAGENAPTCRSTDLPYVRGVNYSSVLDGFVVSDNISFNVTNIDTDFLYSDHNPVRMDFTFLNG